MNNFKYQKKTKPSEEVVNSFKDFDKVLNKHKSISSAYKSIWKYVFIATGAAGISITTLFFYPESNENDLPKTNLSTTIQESTIADVPPQKNKKTKHESVPVLESESSIKKTTPVNVQKNEEVMIPVKTKKVSLEKSEGVEERIELEKWYTLNEKSEKEIIKLPTLFVSNEAWPKKIKKTNLVKAPNIMAFYQSINQEIPIVNGTAYITTDDASEKPIGYKLSGNTFPPGLIREIHKTENSCILLLKNIVLHIPGRGRVNIGDRRIEINLKNKLQKNL